MPVEEVSLRDVPLNAGDDDGDAVNGGADSLLVVSKDDVALSQQVKETALQDGAEGCGQGWVGLPLIWSFHCLPKSPNGQIGLPVDKNSGTYKQKSTQTCSQPIGPPCIPPQF